MDKKKIKVVKESKDVGCHLAENEAELFLKKHVGLIHIENKLSLVQRKICNVLMHHAMPTIELSTHEITIKDLCSRIGYKSNDSKLIKDAVRALITLIMEWNLMEDDKFLDVAETENTAWSASSMLAGATIKQGIVRYSYSPQLKSVITRADIYARLNLFVQSKFKSCYGLVLYENCVRYRNLKQTAWFPLELFRMLMGVPQKKYPSFKEFNRNIISFAVNEVNRKADIYIVPQFRKTGRTVNAVKFTVEDNWNYYPAFSRRKITHASPQQGELHALLTSHYGLSSKQATNVLSSYESEYIMEKICLIKNKKNMDHPGAYLLAALKEDYQAKKKALVTSPKPIENSYLREAKAASEIAPLKNKYMAYKLKVYNEFIKKQPDSLQQTIKEGFEHHLKSNLEVFRFYKKSRLASPFVMSAFLSFVEQKYPHIIESHLSFEDFITAEEIDDDVVVTETQPKVAN